MLWILAGVSIALLIYEGWTLGTSVLLPLLDNPAILQTDFHYYYEAAVRFRGDPNRLYQLSDDVIAGFAYPPPAILPFVVLSYLPFGASLLVFTTISYAVLVAASISWFSYLRRHGTEIESRTAIALALIALSLGPTYSNAVFGQVNALVLGCAVGFITARRLAIGGSLLAAGIWLKIYPVLMAAAVLWDRRLWKAIAYAAFAAVLIAIIALPLVPIGSYGAFVDVIANRGDKTAVHIANQSLMAFVARFSIPPAEFLNWTGREAVRTTVALRAINGIFGLVVIALLWHRAKRSADAATQSAASLIALAAVIAPLGWGHTYVLVLPLVITHLASLQRSPARNAAIVCACVFALMVPAGRRFSFVEQWPAWLQNIAYSRYLIATMILLALPQGDKK